MALGRCGHSIDVNKIGEPRFREGKLLGCDVVHIHRFADPEVAALVKRLKQRGIAIVWDNDDDESVTPRGNRLHRQKASGLNGVVGLRQMQDMLALADVVTTPSTQLAERYRAMGAHDVRVLENYVGDQYLRTESRPHSGVVVGWLAGKEHKADYEGLALSATFARLLDDHPDLRIVSIGLGLGLRSERYEHIQMLRWLNELAPGIAGFDVGLAPLADIPFSRARSNIKVKEYASVGVPWLASPVGPYLPLGEQEGGRLVADGDWYSAISDLVADSRARRRLSKRGRRWSKNESIGRNAHRWLSVFEDAVAHARAGVVRV